MNNIAWQFNILDDLANAEEYAEQSFHGLVEIQGVENLTTIRAAVPYIDILVRRNKLEKARQIIVMVKDQLNKHSHLISWLGEEAALFAKPLLEAQPPANKVDDKE